MQQPGGDIKDETTYKIIGCAMKVHRALGGGFQEVIYQRSMAVAMQRAGLRFEREKEQSVYFGGVAVGTRRADLVVEGNVIVDLKAVHALEAVHFVQAKNYVVAYDFKKGLLISFGGRSLEYRLLFNPRYAR